MIRAVLVVVFVVQAFPSQAGEPCEAFAAQAVTVAPFAIPVAVPVAVVQQPTLFYGYGRYVPSTLPASPTTQPVTPSVAPAIAEESTVSIAALLRKHCAECHQGPTARGGLQLFAADGAPLAQLPRQALAEACAPAEGLIANGAAPTMPPPGRAPLTPQEQAQVRRWAVPPKTWKW